MKRQRNNEVKKCRVCDMVLVEGENWIESWAKWGNYICSDCAREQRRERAGSVRRVVNVAGSAVKVCRVCRVELVLGENWPEGLTQNDYICLTCSRAKSLKFSRRFNETRLMRLEAGEVHYCVRCKVELTAENWASTGRHICKVCNNEQFRLDRKRVRAGVIEKYGGMCACCGEAHIEFLVIDHVNGDGNKERATMKCNLDGFYRKLLREPKRNDLRVLCDNCNMSRARYGYCPHERERQKLAEGF